MKDTIKKSIALLAMTSFIAGCSSTTVITSQPEGAKLYMNNSYVGTTPYTYTDMKVVCSSTTLQLKMDGYEPFTTSLTKNEKLDAGAIVGGVFFLFPFIWTMEYQPMHTYELVPATNHIAKP
jgi:hypothetical protein